MTSYDQSNTTPDSRQVNNPQEKLCDCGNDYVLPGYRVCASCKEAREMCPHLFEGCPPDKLEAFHVGDYVAGGYYAGFIVSHNSRRVYFTWPSSVDDILFYGPPSDMTLIMPASARAYFEQFIGDEGGE